MTAKPIALPWPKSGILPRGSNSLLHACSTFANLAKHPIPNDDIVDIGIWVIHQTGLFAEKYKAWITRGNNPTNNMDFAAFCSFWETTVNCRYRFS